MIAVQAILIPHGVGKPRSLGTLVIKNDGTGTAARGNYTYTLRGKRRVLAEGRFIGFERKRKNVWDLVRFILEEEAMK